MKIQEIHIGKVSIPLRKPFKTALRTVHSAEDVIVRIIADTGETGFGNAPPTTAITGDSQDSIVAAIRDTLAPRIVGMDVGNLEGIVAALDGAMQHNSSPKSALDIAAHDLFAQSVGTPLYRLLGGFRTSMESDITISLNAPDEMVRDAREAIAEGFDTLKIKVGNDAAMDLARVRAVREAVGEGVRIRLDANQGWEAKEAVRLIRCFEAEGLGIELVEQPVKAHDFDGLKYVTDRVDTEIMADESAFGPREVLRLLSMRACDSLNIKLMKAGGLRNAARIAEIAETAGVRCMVGCSLESKVGITAAASLAAGRRIVTRADLDASILLAEDPVAGGARFEKSRLLLPETPGLGISDVDGWKHIVSVPART
jgi:L-alanine-DL-glutamate epimerase-like enolase superfamily enzyme